MLSSPNCLAGCFGESILWKIKIKHKFGAAGTVSGKFWRRLTAAGSFLQIAARLEHLDWVQIFDADAVSLSADTPSGRSTLVLAILLIADASVAEYILKQDPDPYMTDHAGMHHLYEAINCGSVTNPSWYHSSPKIWSHTATFFGLLVIPIKAQLRVYQAADVNHVALEGDDRPP